MKRNLSKRLELVFYIAAALISFGNLAVYWSMRSIWFFIDKAFEGLFGQRLPGASFFFVLFAASFLYSFILFIKRIKTQNADSKGIVWVHIILSTILAIIFSFIDAYLYDQLGSSRNIVMTNLLSALPLFMIVLAIVFFVFFYPELSISRKRGFKYCTAVVLILVTLLAGSNAGEVKITSGPVIQYLDDNNLSVIWTTNVNSTAFVDYGKDENSLKRITSAHHGIIDANSAVHQVVLPIDGQSEFVYRVGSTKINSYYQNSVGYGNTDLSSFKKFKDCRANNTITFYVLNDIHENNNLFREFLSKESYDFIVLNGDIINSADTESVIQNKILKPVSEYTDGTRPFFFVRGNHETRGASVRNLPDYIALPDDQYYFTFQAGPLFAVVLDSGEDKPDSHEEYSGLAGFEEYLGAETAWLETVSQSAAYQDAKYKIAFSHIPLEGFEDQQETSYQNAYQEKWCGFLNRMGVDAVFSGHSHTSKVIPRDKLGFYSFIGGGDSLIEDDFKAIKVEVTSESMKICYINTSGGIMEEYEIN